jgi:hypothetical protein
MFTSFEADIPLYLPNNHPVVHADLEVEITGRVRLSFESMETAWLVTDMIRFNNLLGIHLDLKKIDESKQHLGR